ncbi:MAG: ATP-dependent Clp protease adapter ClpS [Gammaproteobacteria bacterium]|jgi:ATP-dependent Clp protease adaptor protein ClpS|nr:ATP-dependent Clp protease adapter ClpS [Chromatiales bacterium]MCP4925889.1 ATP-dependent Clp protease adapter ClpS [Gammaproteobacteria bacterium]
MKYVCVNTIILSGENDEDYVPGLDDDRGLAIEEARLKVKKPPLYRVVLLNDDYTPMEFVVEVLELIFGMDRPKATRIMLEVHTQGKGVCGVFSYEIAETKVAQVSAFSEQHQHPLLCTLEEL